MYMHACLPTCVSHRSPPRRRLLSWGDAWVPPVNFTAFIWPDEWLAALSVPLPAISSGSLEPHTACRFGRSPQHALSLLLFYIRNTLTDTAKKRGAQLCTDNTILRMYSSGNDMHKNKNNAPIVAAKKTLQSPNTHTHRFLHKAHKHTSASKSIIFISSPMCSYFFLWLHHAHKNIYFC